jgi:uncharacterized membrane protein
MPEKKRPFKLAYSNFVCYLAFYFCNLMLLWSGFSIVWKLYVALAIGLTIHLIHKKDLNILRHRSLLWFGIYITSVFVCSYLSSFGGIAVLAFPSDMLVLFVLSMILFYFSQKCIASKEESLEQIKLLQADLEDPMGIQEETFSTNSEKSSLVTE